MADIKQIQAQYPPGTPVGDAFRNLVGFDVHPPHISTMKSYLISRPEGHRLARHGYVGIGDAAHAVPFVGPLFEAVSVQAAVNDGVALAGLVAKHGPTREAIEIFNNERHFGWQRRRDRVHELLFRLHTEGVSEKPHSRSTNKFHPSTGTRNLSRPAVAEDDKDTRNVFRDGAEPNSIQGAAFIPAAAAAGYTSHASEASPSQDIQPSGPEQWYLKPQEEAEKTFRPRPDERGIWHLNATDDESQLDTHLTRIPPIGGEMTPRFLSGEVVPGSIEEVRQTASQTHASRVARERSRGRGKPWSGTREVPIEDGTRQQVKGRKGSLGSQLADLDWLGF